MPSRPSNPAFREFILSKFPPNSIRGVSPQVIFDGPKPSGWTIPALERELKLLCEDGELIFASGRWYRAEGAYHERKHQPARFRKKPNPKQTDFGL